MSRTMLVLLALTVLPAIASAQADTTRRRDTTRAPQPPDTARRVQAEARGEIDLTRLGGRFRADLPNYGLSSDQAIELQQALTRVGCDVGTIDGIVGQRTLAGIACFRGQRNLSAADLESLLTALDVSFARPAVPVPSKVASPAPPRDTTVLPPVIRPDTTYRADVRARRDSALRRDSTLRRDSLGRDTTARRDTTRRDTTANPTGLLVDGDEQKYRGAATGRVYVYSGATGKSVLELYGRVNGPRAGGRASWPESGGRDRVPAGTLDGPRQALTVPGGATGPGRLFCRCDG